MIKFLGLFNFVSFSFFLIVAILSWAGSHGDSTLSTQGEKQILTIVTSILSLFTLFSILKSKKRTSSVVIIIPFLIYCSFRYLYLYDVNICFEPFYFYLMCLFCFLDSDKKYKVFIYYRRYLVIMGFCGIIAILGYITSLFPFEVLPYYLDIPGTYYINFHFAYFYASETGFRLCGLFNEPGYFGTLLALYLVTDGVKLKRWDNIIMFVAGIFTLSAAFFVLIFVYYIFTWYKSKMMWIVLAVILGIIISVANLDFGNQAVNSTIQRFSPSNKEGIFNMENRAEDAFNKFYQSFVMSEYFLTGMGSGYASKTSFSVLSYKSYVVDYGLIGTILILGSLFLSAYKFAYSNKIKVLYVFIFFLSVYQRPFVFALPYFLALYGGLLYIDYNGNVLKKQIAQ